MTLQLLHSEENFNFFFISVWPQIILPTQERRWAIFTYRSYSARERDIIVNRGKGTLLAKRDNYFQQRYIVEKGRDCCKQREGNIVSQKWEYC
jgi:hypothetical protein